ncbi:MAG: M48 family metallopeptidase [Elusimicrobia bacterium]|nr:M48 family metallopeptidase [Elusimicrobiota bacterium]
MTATLTEPIAYTLLPSKGRKSVFLRVNRDGTVTVRAPRFVSKAYIEQFVAKRSGWITEKQNYFNQLLTLYPPKEFKNGESFQFLGRNLRLRLRHIAGLKIPTCRIEAGRIKLLLNGRAGAELKAAASGAVRNLYARHTALRTAAFVRRHSAALAIKPGRISVVGQKKRWGSCSRKGDIRINWRLAMMPPAVVEYIIVHELCHLKVHDHSLKFWSIVKSVLPDYETRRAWLRRHGPAVFLMADWPSDGHRP